MQARAQDAGKANDESRVRYPFDISEFLVMQLFLDENDVASLHLLVTVLIYVLLWTLIVYVVLYHRLIYVQFILYVPLYIIRSLEYSF